MSILLELDKLTRAEKMRVMEETWIDLSRFDEEYSSPDWHGKVLWERDEALKSGKDGFVSREEVKQMLREKGT